MHGPTHFQGASSACEKALDLDPKYVKAIARKGDIEFLRKEYHKGTLGVR